ncbi:MAG: branched-chain amino acid aminotransferase [Planctomycetota bacterium]|nr:branched-chain amino acid aminotransferase [Planctomycetota bacterium]
MHMLAKLYNDEAGFIVSSELILIATIGVLALVVGLSEVSSAVNQELEDVASAFGAVNQSYSFSGLYGHTGNNEGSKYRDSEDFCDGADDIVGTAATPEGTRGY